MSTDERRAPSVVIVAEMAGFAAARKLERASVEVTLVDGRNYHLFQPLIYEVAGAILNVEVLGAEGDQVPGPGGAPDRPEAELDPAGPGASSGVSGSPPM